jgi:hypothetical protein
VIPSSAHLQYLEARPLSPEARREKERRKKKKTIYYLVRGVFEFVEVN